MIVLDASVLIAHFWAKDARHERADRLLAEAVRRLRTQLDEGVDGYGSLVAAAGRVLAASSLGEPRHDLTEATDHLAGLALALNELSPDE